MTNKAQHSGARVRAMNITLALTLASALTAAPSAFARTYKVLYNFTGGSDGAYPLYGSLVRDRAGNLYGTTSGQTTSRWGTVFKVDPSGKETVLYRFTGGADGGEPWAGLLLAGNTLYGTTHFGGHFGGSCHQGCGVVFAVNITKMTETVLYPFTGGTDGGYPDAGLVRDKAGNLYGTTYYGGSGPCFAGCGVVFKLVPKTGTETVLHKFGASADGIQPSSGLTWDSSAKVLYGTTFLGGSSGWGVVFSLTVKTATYAVLYNFTASADGGAPVGTLSLSRGAVLYGTTVFGGSGSGESGYGVVFQIVPKSGKETVLYTFSGSSDGAWPKGGVIPNKAGKLFGTTPRGGSAGYGTVFEVDPKKGTETVLHAFDQSDGAYPLDGLIQDSKGNFYGTTNGDGSSCCGVVFTLRP